MPGLGALPPTLDIRDQQYHLATLGLPPVTATALPVQTAMPPWKPLDQNGWGTCTAESTLLSLVVAYHKATGKWLYANAKEAQHAAEVLYVEATGDTTKSRGAELRPLLKHANKVGILLPNGTRVRSTSYHCLIPAKDIRADIEAAVAAGMAVVTAWYWPEKWMVDPPFDTLPNPQPNAPLAGGHAIVVWRATMKHPSAGSSALRRDHAFMQSWGEKYGNDGTEYVNAALEVKGWLFDAWVQQV